MCPSSNSSRLSLFSFSDINHPSSLLFSGNLYLSHSLLPYTQTRDITLQDFSHLLQSHPKRLYSESWRRRQIQRSEPVYDPLMVSLGPYHHGKPELRLAEEFKHLCLDWRTGGDEKKKAFFYSKILDEIAVIRDIYAEVTVVEKYDDKSLALMMLLDASIIIDFIHNYLGMEGSSFLAWQRCLGPGSGPLMVRDMMVLKNQIPFRVLKLLLSLMYEREEAALFLLKFMSHKIGVELNNAAIPQENEVPPLHFLEAFRRVFGEEKQAYDARILKRREQIPAV